MSNFKKEETKLTYYGDPLDFSNEEFNVQINDVKTFFKFRTFFMSLKDKTPFKEYILELASYYY